MMLFRISKTNTGQTTDTGFGPVILLALSAALLSLGFQCIHVSGELSFSSKNKLLWEFPVHTVSASHTYHKLPCYMSPLDN